MALDVTSIKAVCFDYGSTLIEFSLKQVDAIDRAMAACLQQRFGTVDLARLQAIREADRLAPFSDGFRENNIAEITERLLRTLYPDDAAEHVLAELMQARFEAFLACIEGAADVPAFIERLRRRYRVALISNYPDGTAIRGSLERIGWGRAFDSVVVSGDVGWCKPHPLPFTTALEQLGVEPAEAVHVGDNWLADVQGAKRVGMQAVLTRQWQTPEVFEPQDGDHAPDLIIHHLSELEPLLLSPAG